MYFSEISTCTLGSKVWLNSLIIRKKYAHIIIECQDIRQNTGTWKLGQPSTNLMTHKSVSEFLKLNNEGPTSFLSCFYLGMIKKQFLRCSRL